MSSGSTKKNIHANHRKRMRERFSKNGFTGYHPHEVMEQVLFEVIPRCNTNETGHRLINKFGSIENALHASAKELERIDGLGSKSAEYLSTLLDKGGDMIKEQFRTLDNLTVYQVALLADWFMMDKDSCIGLIVCDADKKFLDFTFIEADVDASEPSDGVLRNLCDEITSIVSSGTYILLFKNVKVERSWLYRLMDMTKKNGAIMLNSYRMVKRRPVSIIFPN